MHDLKQIRLPEINPEFLSSIGFDNLEELRDAVREALKRQNESQQKQTIRRQILDALIAATPFDLPADLVSRQEKSTTDRLVMELRQEGFSDNDIRAREAEIRANAHEMTLRSLKEFFILARIAEAEGIKVEEEDFELEIEAMAARTDESVRRVRARVEKEGLGDALATQILERKALDHILKFVEIEDVHLDEVETDVETVDQSASPAVEPDAAESAPRGSDLDSVMLLPRPSRNRLGAGRLGCGEVARRVPFVVAVHQLCCDREFSSAPALGDRPDRSGFDRPGIVHPGLFHAP